MAETEAMMPPTTMTDAAAQRVMREVSRDWVRVMLDSSVGARAKALMP
jgi:hypothetical protein